jgi:indole-3-glycerol phosphate synthase
MSRVYLKDIIEAKQKRLEEKNYRIEEMKAAVRELPAPASFSSALTKKGLSIIGEVKKASPSKGMIRENFNPLEIARTYNPVVDAISVLTEEDYFLGNITYLKEISAQVTIPTLCKDFIISPEQIYEARLAGASAILLIVAILSDEQLSEYLNLAHSLNMSAIVEVHNQEELDRALKTNCRIIGINNRNLETFVTDIQTTLDLAPQIPRGRILISESGISDTKDIQRLAPVKIDAVLVGESFMRSDNIVKHAKELKYGNTD